MSKLSFDELTNLYTLLSVDGIGPAKIRNLLARFKSTENILSQNNNTLIETEGISTTLASKIQKASRQRNEIQAEVEIELNLLQKIGGRIVTVWDKDFPDLLKKIYDPPLLLYYKGNFSDSDNYCIAIVGTRGPTNYGKVRAEKISSELAEQGITIVSGLARGVDSIAHKAALKNGGRTIAVIGSGLDVVYPSENKRLFEEIAEKGLIISEYKLKTKPDAQNFPRRNRIISGLSLGCVIIESGVDGGAMQTASFALDQNREVFAVPGNLGIRQSDGTNLLIQKGEAKLIRSSEDILLELELKLKPAIGKNIPKPRVDLNIFEERILSVISENAVQIDKIAELTKLSTSDCLVQLLSLEFKGMVKQLPGKLFIAL